MLDYKGDYSYANQRLAGTYIYYEGSPILVVSIDQFGVVTFNRCGLGGDAEKCRLSECSLEPLRLGYINDGPLAHYLRRFPARVQRQGLQDRIMYSSMGRIVALESIPFLNCVIGSYPNLNVCLELVANKEVQSVAFSRTFALKVNERNNKIEYKGKIVGSLVGESLKLKLDKGREYLQESLERNCNGKPQH